MDLFDQLPLSAIINNKFLCIHGGISTEIQSVNHPQLRFRIFRRFRGQNKSRNQACFVIWCGQTLLIMILESLMDWPKWTRREDAHIFLDLNWLRDFYKRMGFYLWLGLMRRKPTGLKCITGVGKSNFQQWLQSFLLQITVTSTTTKERS